jgi:hypothetical protein
VTARAVDAVVSIPCASRTSLVRSRFLRTIIALNCRKSSTVKMDVATKSPSSFSAFARSTTSANRSGVTPSSARKSLSKPSTRSLNSLCRTVNSSLFSSSSSNTRHLASMKPMRGVVYIGPCR